MKVYTVRYERVVSVEVEVAAGDLDSAGLLAEELLAEGKLEDELRDAESSRTDVQIVWTEDDPSPAELDGCFAQAKECKSTEEEIQDEIEYFVDRWEQRQLAYGDGCCHD